MGVMSSKPFSGYKVFSGMNIERAWQRFTPHTRQLIARLAGVDIEHDEPDFTKFTSSERWKIRTHMLESNLSDYRGEYHRNV